MFYMYRVIFVFLALAVLCVIGFFVRRRNENERMKTNVKNKILLIFKLIVVCIGLFFILCQFPLEAPFLKFDTPEEALEYRGIDTDDVDVLDYDDCVFVVGEKDEIYSITKSDGKFRFVDYRSEDEKYYQKSINYDFETFIYAKYNRATDKTLYLVAIAENESLAQKDVFMNASYKMEFVKTYTTKFPDPFQNEMHLYAKVFEEKPTEKFFVDVADSSTTYFLD